MPRDDVPGTQLPPRLDPRAGRPRRDPEQTAGRSAGSARRVATAVRLLAGVMAVVVMGGSGWGWYLARVAEASITRTDAIPTDGNVDASGTGHAGQEMNLLLVGRDSRAGLTPEQVAEFSTGDPSGLLNTDTMILVHIPADGSAASFVSIPRDLYVPIPGHGSNKLNSAFGFGYNDTDGDEAAKNSAGAQLLIQTISQTTGVQIDHYAEVNLLGFINLTTIVGGVEVNLCEPSQDDMSGADFEAGPQTISGAAALAFVRQRHHIGVNSTDLDRQVRQQAFIAGLLRNVLSSDLLLNPVKQREVIEQVGTSVAVDQGLDLFQLAGQMQSVRPGNITFQTIPGITDATVDGASVLQAVDDDALRDFFAGLGTPTTPAAPTVVPTEDAPAPAEVDVTVLNGSGVSGAAASAAEELAAAGFPATVGGNAPESSDTTTVLHRSGEEAQAAVLAAQVPGAAVVADDTLAPGAGVQLVLGSDFNGIGQPVTVEEAAPTDGTYASVERTAEDTSCIA